MTRRAKNVPLEAPPCDVPGGSALSVRGEGESRRGGIPGRLILVSMPIGNEEDISLRALRVLREAALVAAEDAGAARKRLAFHGIETPVLAFRSRAKFHPVEETLAHLRAGKDVAFVVDAGTPGIADPGQSLVAAAREEGIPVTGVPGPSALIAALSLSGMPSGRFAFEGFPPRGRTDRPAFFEVLSTERRTIILYESSAYLLSTLDALRTVLGADRQVAVAASMTTPRESLVRGALSEACERFRQTRPRGTFTIVVGGIRE